MKKLTNPMLIALYKLYQINYESLATDMKNRIRTQANRIYKKEFGNRNWDALTLNEQNYFILHCMKDYMIGELKDVLYRSRPSKVKEVIEKIESKIKEQYVSESEVIKQYNADLEKLYTKDENGYSRFGDLQDEILEIYKSGDDSNNFATDIRLSTIDTKIDVILKIIQEKLSVHIDIKAIEDCCKYLIKNDLNNDDIIQLEIDEQSSVPVEVQQKIIESNQKYFAYRIQKENLEFYKDKE